MYGLVCTFGDRVDDIDVLWWLVIRKDRYGHTHRFGVFKHLILLKRFRKLYLFLGEEMRGFWGLVYAFGKTSCLFLH